MTDFFVDDDGLLTPFASMAVGNNITTAMARAKAERFGAASAPRQAMIFVYVFSSVLGEEDEGLEREREGGRDGEM